MQSHAWLKSLALLMSLAAGGWVVGCGSDNNKNDGGSGGHAGNGGAVDAGAVLTDGQIASIMIEANTGEIAAASIALAKAASPAVTSFAALMITDYTAANGHLASIAQQQSILLGESAIRQTLAMQSTQTVNGLIATSWPGMFDLAYASSQVTTHAMVLQLLDDQLIPDAQNAALKAELQVERTTVMNHLTAAQQLQASLADACATDAATGN